MSNIKSVTVTRETNADGTTHTTICVETINPHAKKVRGIEAIQLLNEAIAAILDELL